MSKYPDRYVIIGKVKEGEHAGEQVWIRWSDEGGGWWQWTNIEGWAERFESKDDPRFKDAMNSALGKTWTKSTCGPWYYYADIPTVEAVAVPARVRIIVD